MKRELDGSMAATYEPVETAEWVKPTISRSSSDLSTGSIVLFIIGSLFVICFVLGLFVLCAMESARALLPHRWLGESWDELQWIHRYPKIPHQDGHSVWLADPVCYGDLYSGWVVSLAQEKVILRRATIVFNTDTHKTSNQSTTTRLPPHPQQQPPITPRGAAKHPLSLSQMPRSSPPRFPQQHFLSSGHFCKHPSASWTFLPSHVVPTYCTLDIGRVSVGGTDVHVPPIIEPHKEACRPAPHMPTVAPG